MLAHRAQFDSRTQQDLHMLHKVAVGVWDMRYYGFDEDVQVAYQTCLPGIEYLEESIANLLLAQFHIDSGQPEQALPPLGRNLKINAQDTASLTLLGAALGNLGYSDRARQQLVQSRELNSSYPGTNRELGRLAIAEGRYKEGIHYHREEYGLRPSCEMNVVNLIEARHQYHIHRHGRRAKNYAELINARYWDRLADGELDLDCEPESRKSIISLACDKCGTHLIADVIQAITGQTSDWQYHPDRNPMKRYPKPVASDSFIAGNWYPNVEMLKLIRQQRSRVVLQYRDPRDQLISGYFYCQKPDVLVNDTGFSQSMRELPKHDALSQLIKNWPYASMEWLVGWVESDVPLLLTTFEEMVGNKPRVVDELARYLAKPLSEAQRDAVVEATHFKKKSASLTIENVSETFKRKGVAGDWRNHFTPELVELYKQEVGRVTLALGFEHDPNWQA
ncbi:MAG: sulfotransferase domain-containing protein [Magnetococcales bacterium]|nr:sulfotransferase domain-containing protein [Magnetococcales bacterium]